MAKGKPDPKADEAVAKQKAEEEAAKAEEEQAEADAKADEKADVKEKVETKRKDKAGDCRKCIFYLLKDRHPTTALSADLLEITDGYRLTFCGTWPHKTMKRYDPRINCIGKKFKLAE
jgi:hypothetical protein